MSSGGLAGIAGLSESRRTRTSRAGSTECGSIAITLPLAAEEGTAGKRFRGRRLAHAVPQGDGPGLSAPPIDCVRNFAAALGPGPVNGRPRTGARQRARGTCRFETHEKAKLPAAARSV